MKSFRALCLLSCFVANQFLYNGLRSIALLSPSVVGQTCHMGQEPEPGDPTRLRWINEAPCQGCDHTLLGGVNMNTVNKMVPQCNDQIVGKFFLCSSLSEKVGYISIYLQ
ncbi:uncharacterized protein [Amphiura filiformis]|uniref:uncharacterized protein n=1 Tax=Amphiura filiformis TaxID=82378 RepID=UPI003B20E10D